MSTEAVESQEVEVAVDDEAFAAGFSEARGDEPPASEPAPEPVQAEEQAEQPAVEAEPEPEPQQNLIAGMTEDQLRAAILKANEVDHLKSQLDKAFGKVGEVNRTLMQLQQRSSVNLDKAKFKRLSEEFPEIAEMLASDLNDALGEVGGQSPAVDPEQFEKVVDERLIAMQQAQERRFLSRMHRDWESVVTSDEFKLWQQNVLPPEDAQVLATSWDSDFISDKLDEFKAWRSKATAAKENKQKRLEQAVTPRGDTREPPTAQTEDEAFLAAFKSARGR